MIQEAPVAEAPAPQPEQPKGPPRIKYTAKIRRGLYLVRMLVAASFDDAQPPSETIVKRWNARQVREFNAALAWLEQEEIES